MKLRKKAVFKWLTWIGIIVAGAYIGGDFGILAALVLIFMTR